MKILLRNKRIKFSLSEEAKKGKKLKIKKQNKTKMLKMIVIIPSKKIWNKKSSKNI